jgi:hypothetical protein
LSCDNPFFPETDKPLIVKPQRSTIAGVLAQLYQSYEQRRLDLFETVLTSDSTFRFYVTPNFDVSQSKYTGWNRPELPDSFMKYVAPALYYYWDYAVEIQRHKKMFQTADIITFQSKPVIFNVNYITDTITNDTVMAEVQTQGGVFEVAVNDPDANMLIKYEIGVQTQVFLMELRVVGDNKLWFIRKWYDLGQERN